MSGSEGLIISFDACDGIIEDLNNLEQAITEICPFDMQVEICTRKREIKETMNEKR